MAYLVHTGTLRIEEFSLAGDGLGLIDVVFDIECYSDGDWDIARIGLVWGLKWPTSEAIRWLDKNGAVGEHELIDAIRIRALETHSDTFADFARCELAEVA